MLLNLLLDTTKPVDKWISDLFPILQTVMIIAITIFALIILIAVLAQPSKPAGGNVITGANTSSYYAQNKGRTKEGRLTRLIVISAISIFVLTILYFISFAVYKGF